MPYIIKEDRPKIDEVVDKLDLAHVGELNYAITRIAHQYLKKAGVRYANINEVIGVLDCAKMELYRRIAAPYEDKKIDIEGNVGVLKTEN